MCTCTYICKLGGHVYLHFFYFLYCVHVYMAMEEQPSGGMVIDMTLTLTLTMQTLRACHLCTLNVAAIFGGAIPTYGVGSTP